MISAFTPRRLTARPATPWATFPRLLRTWDSSGPRSRWSRGSKVKRSWRIGPRAQAGNRAIQSRQHEPWKLDPFCGRRHAGAVDIAGPQPGPGTYPHEYPLHAGNDSHARPRSRPALWVPCAPGKRLAGFAPVCLHLRSQTHGQLVVWWPARTGARAVRFERAFFAVAE